MTAAAIALFVPANRPERLVKAIHSGADAVILDLEDGLGGADAREGLDTLGRVLHEGLARAAAVDIGVRLPADGSAELPSQLRSLLAALDMVRLPKVVSAQDAADRLAELRSSTATQGGPVPCFEITVECAAGVQAAGEIAKVAGVGRLVLGYADLAADLGLPVDWVRDAPAAMSHATATVLVAARAAGLSAPSAGATTSLDAEVVERESSWARTHGCGGKSAIHPRQIPAIRAGFRPSEAEQAWASAVLSAATHDRWTGVVHGRFVDAAVIRQARQIVHKYPRDEDHDDA